MQNSKLRHVLHLCLLGLWASNVLAAPADNKGTALVMETHAAFFSGETKQNLPLDPQVFVSAPNSAAAVGPQGIKHEAGVRPAMISDNPALPIMNASGKSLGMNLGAWLSAKGNVIFTNQPSGKQKVTVIFSGLKPKGQYSLFENHFDETPIGFTPLDGNGTDNNFVADFQGNAAATIYAPKPLTSDNAVLLVYHSDGQTHGQRRGNIGVDAHHQLIVKP
jgi:hypothetical protein